MSQSIRTLLEEGIETGVFPGASLLIAKGADIILTESVGFSQTEPTKKILTPETIFDIASLTKPFCTATLFMLAVSEKKVDLDEPLNNYFSEAKNKTITLQHLLNHTSGLPAWKNYFELWNNVVIPAEAGIQKKNGPDSLETHTDHTNFKSWITNQLLEEAKKAKPSSPALYSDLGYILLGEVLEKIYSQPLNELFQKKIANPLDLEHTFFIPLTLSQPGFSSYSFAATENCPWRKKVLIAEVEDEHAWLMNGVAGHAGLFSTTQDIHRWLMELDLARQGKSQLIEKRIFETFCTIPKKRNLAERFFTLGFDTPSAPSSSGSYFSQESLGHLGYSGTSFWWDVTTNLMVIFLTNRVHPTRRNEKIKQFRPKLHDAIFETLNLNTSSP